MLVIGLGYLGNAVASLAGRSNWNVTRATLSPEEPGVLQADAGDLMSLKKLAASIPDPDIIILTASTNRGDEDDYKHVFVDGCGNLTAVFPKGRIIMCSSTSVYGATDGSAVNENSPATPEKLTARLLLEAERIVLDSGGTVARLSSLYGPGRSVLLQRLIDDAAFIEGEKPKFLNHIHRDDAASALLCLASSDETGGQIYNVSDSMPLEQKKLYAALAALLDKPAPPVVPVDSGRKRAWTNKYVENNKLLSLGWKPCYPSFLEAFPDLAPTMPGYEIRVDDDEEDDDDEKAH